MRRCQRQAKGVLFAIGHEQQPLKAVINLRRRSDVRMWVIPVSARAVGHFEVVDVLGIVIHGESRVSVRTLGYIKSVPVNDRRFAESIKEPDSHALTPPHADDGTEV